MSVGAKIYPIISYLQNILGYLNDFLFLVN